MPPQYRFLLSHVGPDAYAPMTRVLLGKLGYLILLPEELASIEGSESLRPEARLLDRSQLAMIPADGDSTPILLLSDPRKADREDPRIAGAVKQPAGAHELYSLLQRLTEATPRSSPRVPTRLEARCRRGEREWAVTILSVSENGCLVHSPDTLELSELVRLSFDLPRARRVDVEAEAAYQLGEDTGLIFQDAPSDAREAIRGFVDQTLLS